MFYWIFYEFIKANNKNTLNKILKTMTNNFIVIENVYYFENSNFS